MIIGERAYREIILTIALYIRVDIRMLDDMKDDVGWYFEIG